ncbi:hypothetical protein OEZ86_012810 [Tetradesmus obliquus]|nr:hypothetical protein OEZ86_012810 [Tetradesmus obliquus]
MQSSSSVPADSTVYVSTKAPACPDMPKQQPNNSAGPQRAVLCMPRAPPSLFAGMPGVRSSSDKALTSSDNSTPGREQPLQLIIQLQDNNSASTDASQAATIATLTWKVTTLTSKIDTLQEQLSMISTSGRVKAISAHADCPLRRGFYLPDTLNHNKLDIGDSTDLTPATATATSNTSKPRRWLRQPATTTASIACTPRKQAWMCGVKGWGDGASNPVQLPRLWLVNRTCLAASASFPLPHPDN